MSTTRLIAILSAIYSIIALSSLALSVWLDLEASVYSLLLSWCVSLWVFNTYIRAMRVEMSKMVLARFTLLYCSILSVFFGVLIFNISYNQYSDLNRSSAMAFGGLFAGITHAALMFPLLSLYKSAFFSQALFKFRKGL
jgi:hypothetical protein